MVSPDVVDVNILHRLRALQADGEPDVVADVVKVFLDDAPGRIAGTRAALGSAQPAVAERLAHSLKSSAAMLGAMTLSSLAAEVEARARSGALAADDPLIGRLESAFDEVREAFGLLGLDA